MSFHLEQIACLTRENLYTKSLATHIIYNIRRVKCTQIELHLCLWLFRKLLCISRVLFTIYKVVNFLPYWFVANFMLPDCAVQCNSTVKVLDKVAVSKL